RRQHDLLTKIAKENKAKIEHGQMLKKISEEKDSLNQIQNSPLTLLALIAVLIALIAIVTKGFFAPIDFDKGFGGAI
ncbi:MAG: hypothetical protein EZS28_026364, partial [Streblomastix strix]